MAQTVTVDRIKERRSNVANYRPGMKGSRLLDPGEGFINFADKIRRIGNADGTFIEYSINTDAEKAAPGNPIGDTLATKLGLTRMGIGFAKIPAVILTMALAGYYTLGDRAFGMPMVRTTAADTDPTKVADGSDTPGYWKLNAPNIANVFWLGAKGDFVTNDTPAFNTAQAVSQTVYAPASTYNIQNFTLNAGKNLNGDGIRLTIFRPTATCVWVVRCMSGCDLKDFATNGNNFAGRGISCGGDHVNIENWRAEYCYSGYYNETAGVVVRMFNTSTANCTYSFYCAGGWNNSSVTKHISDGDIWGFFSTYTGNPDLDQPQAVRFSDCLFFGNQNGIWFDKNVFVFSFVNSVIDGCPGTAIRIGEDSDVS
jgi:hypothetical protein